MPEDSRYDINALFTKVGEGDEGAFKIVIDLYKERFYAASLKMTHSGELAAEIIQEVFVSLWIKRAMVAAANNPEAYLFTMLHNNIYAYFRKLALEKAMIKKVSLQFNYIDASPVEDRLFAKEDRELYEAVINQLPSQQKIIYKLSRQQGMSRQQIASELQISPHTVKNHLLQAVKTICTHYKEETTVFVWVTILLFF